MAASSFKPQPGTLSLVDQLLTMARTVQQTAYSAMDCLAEFDESALDSIFHNESRINSLEMFVDERVMRMLSGRKLDKPEIRMILATLRINRELERIGDLSVNIAERLRAMQGGGQTAIPSDIIAMTKPVRQMLAKSILSLQIRNFTMANDVLSKEHTVDEYRDHLYGLLIQKMTDCKDNVRQNINLLLISRHLERIADHSTNIAEGVIYWLRGVDVRHGNTITALRKRKA